MKDILQKFGLTKNETEVYLGFYSNPLVSAAKLSRLMKMDKSSVYKAVDRLYELKLLIASQSKYGLVYRSVDPENLKELYNSARSELEVDKSNLFEFIDKLKSEGKQIHDPYVTIEYGIEAVEKRMEMNLKSKEKLIRERFRVHQFFKDKDHINFVKRYARKRIKNGIMMKQLEFDYDSMEKTFGEIMNKPKKYLKEIRILPEELDDNNSFIIWDNNINIISETEDNEVLVISIKDPNVAQLMKNIFDFIWKQGGEVPV
ncbi:hypothetical protein KC660_01945 [Candidatus Dojkabacteria bacterium]|uniref:Transcription regulator TrmB N-terminal domain-containing protein n=1 Tax=Candidatus Dojkabacteria bacterium TaxID=2099670 RepID=A0A955L3C9_9BACT|nr:hypothetical protein [Candidatus Dojkabacteria bacterium]